ncbi:triacylglycerol lipase [Candidatus Deferrimicrobium sp.]|uniref:esterase/lipase family protein n=1 Tax=Candidatus Deferrimicrobium sp. TaxID=3060586 RepID=UPI002719A063|nr:alpha/beta hydrolase [Candidatus Deferrimicrobium sp.]MDO8738373.1 alpha/beta fold hydrolase [Candidatus Deferrimicrobium sp.]
MGGNPVESEKSEAVVLVHGLWMTGTEMRVLGGRLEESGFRVRTFRYRSWRGGLAQAAGALREFVEATEGERVHLVGHSLGGVVIAKMLGDVPLSRPGRVAMLGSPMGGSAAARILSRRRVGRWLVGGVIREGIVEHAPKWPAGRELLVVAGDIPLGSGLLLGLLKPHDGVIRVEETRVEGARMVTVRASHVGLLLSRKVAALLSDYFRAG